MLILYLETLLTLLVVSVELLRFPIGQTMFCLRKIEHIRVKCHVPGTPIVVPKILAKRREQQKGQEPSIGMIQSCLADCCIFLGYTGKQ